MTADTDAWRARIDALDAISLTSLREELLNGPSYFDAAHPQHYGVVQAMPMIAARLAKLENEAAPVVEVSAQEREAAERQAARTELSEFGHAQATAGTTDVALAASDSLRRMDAEDAATIKATTNLAELQAGWIKEAGEKETKQREDWVQGEFIRQTKGGMRGRVASNVRADAEALYDKHHAPEAAA